MAHWLGDNNSQWPDMKDSIAGQLLPFCSFNFATIVDFCEAIQLLARFFILVSVAQSGLLSSDNDRHFEYEPVWCSAGWRGHLRIRRVHDSRTLPALDAGEQTSNMISSLNAMLI